MQYEIFVRALVLVENERKILLCKNEQRDFYYLPGVSVAFGQSAEEALREYFKKFCKTEAKQLHFLGTFENIYGEDGVLHHQYSLVFKIEDHMTSADHPADNFVYE